jgi:hypothetical protein
MAKIKLSSFIADMRGKINGHVASKGRFGNYLRNKVTPVNRKTVAQQSVRAFFTSIAQSWRGCTAAQRAKWNSESKGYSRLNIFGDNTPLSGFGLFMKLNGNLKAIGESIITDCPQHEQVLAPSAITAEIDTGVLTLDLGQAMDSSASGIVFATPPLSAGKSFVKSEYRQIKVVNNASTATVVLTSDYVAAFGALPAASQNAFIKVKTVGTANGIPASTVSCQITFA